LESNAANLKADGQLVSAERKPMKKAILFASLAFALVVALPARAQGGCDDTPENPTLILAGLSGGVFAISSLRTRMRARRKIETK
jgi:XrtJ-associated TM-motif-TM protein